MSIDAKRDEFRRYLEQSGVMEALTRALVQLMEEPEKPTDAVAYLRDILPGELGPAMEDTSDEVSLQRRIDKANNRIRDLEIAIERLKAANPNLAPDEITNNTTEKTEKPEQPEKTEKEDSNS